MIGGASASASGVSWRSMRKVGQASRMQIRLRRRQHHRHRTRGIRDRSECSWPTAGADQEHPWMITVANGMAEEGLYALTF